MPKDSKPNQNRLAQDKHSRKREAVLGNKRNRSFYKAVAAIALLLLFVAGGYFMFGKQDATSSLSDSTAIQRSETEIAYPVELFNDGKAQHFQYETGEGIAIKYFILKSSDSVIRAAFDACDVCWPAGKGYYQDGDVMVCRNCGRKFASVRVNEVKGGCNPAPLRRRVENNKLVIEVADVLMGRRYFDFDSRS